MKTKSLLLLIAALAGTSLLQAEKTAAGPKGGRLLESQPLKAEFFVTADRKVEITFYDAGLKPAAPGTQTLAVTAEPATGRTALELEQTATGFVSKATLPAGEPYRVVVQVRATASAKPQNFRIDLNLAACGECQRAEYACTCEGH
jgi:hypothetical protein